MEQAGSINRLWFLNPKASPVLAACLSHDIVTLSPASLPLPKRTMQES